MQSSPLHLLLLGYGQASSEQSLGPPDEKAVNVAQALQSKHRYKCRW